MYSHLLVPVDGTELSERAAQASLDLAKKLGSKITGFVVEPMPPLPTMAANLTAYQRETDAHQARTEAHAQAVLAKFASMAADQGITFQGKFQRNDSVDGAIIKAAGEFGCDLIVMVTHGRGAFGELLFGSHTKNVLSRCKVPLLVLH
jgi:nucleotide-binding universal stress UspA family protein